MAAVKNFTTELAFYSQSPNKPTQGFLIGAEQSAKRVLGSTLINAGWGILPPRIESMDEPDAYKLVFTLRRKAAQRRFDAEGAQSKALQIQERILGHLPGWKIFSAADKTIEKEYTVAEMLKFPDDIHDHFSHIYERDLHIREVLDSIALARDTDMRVRQHILLHGHPGCAKSELALVLPKIFGEHVVKKLDATSLTRAGAEKMLLDATIVPPIIILEEIEKTHESNLPWLLAVLDVRGELIKTTARKDVSRLTRCLVIATANNIDKLSTYQEGALADRFNNKLYCPLPDRPLLEKILRREVESIPGGNQAWVEPALDYALNVERTYQVRRALAIMALGRDRLLTGEYQREHQALRDRELKDAERITEFNIHQ